MEHPSAWKPLNVGDFIGPAGRCARLLSAVAQRAKTAGDSTLKYLLYGPPGVGKTAVARAVARELTDSDIDIQIVAGRNLRSDGVAQLRREFGGGNLYGDWLVLIIDEADTCPRDGQDALLTFLDELPANRAVLATSNCDLDELTGRFQTRFQHLPFDAPSAADIAGLLRKFDGVDAAKAREIAAGADGNVRAALLDAQTHVDVQRYLTTDSAETNQSDQMEIGAQ